MSIFMKLCATETILYSCNKYWTFQVALVVKNLPTSAGDASLIHGWGKIPWRRAWKPFLYSCRENPMDGGAWPAAVHKGHKESDTTEAT